MFYVSKIFDAYNIHVPRQSNIAAPIYHQRHSVELFFKFHFIVPQSKKNANKMFRATRYYNGGRIDHSTEFLRSHIHYIHYITHFFL